MVQNFTNSFSTKSNIIFGSTSLKDVFWYVQRFPIPEIQMDGIRTNSRAGSRLYLPADTVTFGPLMLDVIVDKDMVVYDTLYAHFVKRLNIDTGSFDKSGYFDIWVQVNDGEGNAIRKFTFEKARLTNFGGLEFDSTDEGDSEQIIQLTFEYNTFDYDNCFLKMHPATECERAFPKD